MSLSLPLDDTNIRLIIFLVTLGVLACLEAVFPRRKSERQRINRWPHNLGVSIVSQLLVRVAVPVTAVAFANKAAAQDWGLFNQIAFAPGLEFILAILLLDLTIYWQHRLFHYLGSLWRLHRMHHADIFFDVTTGIRFHPLSILLSVLIKLGTILLLGPAASAVLVFEILLNATSLFNHSNFRIPSAVDKYLRLFVVTPDMHRVHHSIDGAEMNRNFGFNFPWWDRLFGTYQAAPAAGHEQMEIGLSEFRDQSERHITAMLTQPFR